MTDDDRALMVAAAEGSTEAFGHIVARHQSRVAGHIQRLIGPRDRDDLTQDTFLRAWDYRANYDSRHSLIGWLLVIASRLCWNHTRDRRSKRLVSLEACGEVPRPDPSPAAAYAEDDQRRHLAELLECALDGLQPQVRTLYELRYRQDLAIEEIAEHLGTTGNAVKQRLHRLRAALRTALEGASDER